MKPNEMRALAERHVPGVQAIGAVERLVGGFVNHVWRIEGRPHHVVVKHARETLELARNANLSPERAKIETVALQAFRGTYRELQTHTIRVPELYAYLPEHHLMFLEDLENPPALDQYITETSQPVSHLALDLGRFIARLHCAPSFNGHASKMHNADVQDVRYRLQYTAVRRWLEAAGYDDARGLGGRCEALGRKLLKRGRCWVMGDLWPRSVLVNRDRAHIIDWEFSHWGYEAQDIGHLLAHLFMIGHTADDPNVTLRASDFAEIFSESYLRNRPRPLPADAADQLATHLAAEILMRTYGPFGTGYLYDGASRDTIADAAEMAVRHLRGDTPLLKGF